MDRCARHAEWPAFRCRSVIQVRDVRREVVSERDAPARSPVAERDVTGGVRGGGA
ncbi:hypothetical protein GCM10010428_09300 [Actinosynnema pretiosum subsp. pretiosum]